MEISVEPCGPWLLGWIQEPHESLLQASQYTRPFNATNLANLEEIAYRILYRQRSELAQENEYDNFCSVWTEAIRNTEKDWAARKIEAIPGLIFQFIQPCWLKENS